MKIIFTSSYKTYSKQNTKNYTSNFYVLVFLISVIFFFLQFGTEEVLNNAQTEELRDNEQERNKVKL